MPKTPQASWGPAASRSSSSQDRLPVSSAVQPGVPRESAGLPEPPAPAAAAVPLVTGTSLLAIRPLGGYRGPVPGEAERDVDGRARESGHTADSHRRSR